MQIDRFNNNIVITIVKTVELIMETKIRKIGNNLGVTLPKQLIDELHLQSGDTLTIEKKGSILELKPVDPEFEEWTEAYRQANTDYKNVLKELAK